MALAPETASAIIEEIFEGMLLKDSLKKHKVRQSSFYKFLSKNVKFEDMYARAKAAHAHLIVEEIVPIADDPDIDPARARNMIDARKWTASKIIPHKYGDRIELNLKNEVSIVDALALARARVLPMRDLASIEEAEIVETKQLTHDGATGSQPVVAESNVIDEVNVANESRNETGDIFD